MPSDPFESPLLRISRAKEHIQDFHTRTDAFMKKEPWAKVTELDPDGFHEVHKMRFIGEIPSNLRAVAAEAADGLRSALDQAVFATAALAGKPDAKSAYFPIADDISGLDNVIKGRCKDVPPDIITLLRAFKPYEAGNPLIWSFNKLRQSNQHKILVPLGIALGPTTFSYSAAMITGGMVTPYWDSAKNEIVYARFGPGTRNVDYDIQFRFTIAFNPIGIGGRGPALLELQRFVSEAERIVRALKAECVRIGLM